MSNPMKFQPVILESPFSGDTEANLRYLRACMRDALLHRGEAPFASHGLYTQAGVLDDRDPHERAIGIAAGFAWRELAVRTVFCVDRGWSTGMNEGMRHAVMMRHPYVPRSIPGSW